MSSAHGTVQIGGKDLKYQQLNDNNDAMMQFCDPISLPPPASFFSTPPTPTNSVSSAQIGDKNDLDNSLSPRSTPITDVTSFKTARPEVPAVPRLQDPFTKSNAERSKSPIRQEPSKRTNLQTSNRRNKGKSSPTKQRANYQDSRKNKSQNTRNKHQLNLTPSITAPFSTEKRVYDSRLNNEPLKTQSGMLTLRLLISERDYIHTLVYGFQTYRDVIRKEENWQASSEKSVFSNLDEIMIAQEIIWKELEKVINQWPRIDIGTIFINTIIPACKLYLEFIPNVPMSLASLESCKRIYKTISNSLKLCSEKYLLISLPDLFVLPEKRLPDYEAYLAQMIDLKHGDENAQATLIRAHEKMLDLLKMVNVRREDTGNELKVLEIISNIQDYVGEKLTRPGRKFITEGPLLVYNEPDPNLKQLISPIADYVYVFNDIILYVKQRRTHMSYVGTIWMHKTALLDFRDTAIIKNGFKVAHRNDNLIFVSNHPNDKGEWLRYFNQAISDSERTKKVFGVSLNVLMSREEEEKNDIPSFLLNTTKFIFERALCLQGIFRESGRASEVARLKDMYDLGHDVCLDDCDPHAVSNVIKLWFRELPQPIIPWEMFLAFRRLNEEDTLTEILDEMKKHVNLLPRHSKNVLQHIMRCFKEITKHEEENKMIPSNIGIVFGPNCVRTISESDMNSFDTTENQQKIEIVAFLVSNYDALFSEIEEERKEIQKRVIPTSTRATNSLSPESLLKLANSIKEEFSFYSPLFTKAGVMKKKGKRLWNTYWIVVRYKFIFWFRKPEDDKPKSWLNLKNCRVEVSMMKSLGIEIHTPNPHKPMHLLVAITDQERDEWLKAISSCIEQTIPNVETF